MTIDPPEATEVIPQVADGIESLAIHPSGRLAVFSCLEDGPGVTLAGYSHLAVVDLTKTPATLLYYLVVESIPENHLQSRWITTLRSDDDGPSNCDL